MTTAHLSIDKQSNISFDCVNHAGDWDVCTMITAYCNVLVAECLRHDVYPTVYEAGHIHIDFEYASDSTKEVFLSVWDAIKATAEEYPEHISA